MDFKKGDVCFTYFGKVTECVILKVLPNTNRYKIAQEGWNITVRAHELYSTKDKVITAQIEALNSIITLSQSRIRGFELEYSSES